MVGLWERGKPSRASDVGGAGRAWRASSRNRTRALCTSSNVPCLICGGACSARLCCGSARPAASSRVPRAGYLYQRKQEEGHLQEEQKALHSPGPTCRFTSN